MEYDPWKFKALYETKLGKSIWDFLNEDDNIIRMETASLLRRPAVEGIAKHLKNRFGTEIKHFRREGKLLRLKQMIGHMVKQIMAEQGFEVYKKGVRVITDDLFSKATRYYKPTI